MCKAKDDYRSKNEPKQQMVKMSNIALDYLRYCDPNQLSLIQIAIVLQGSFDKMSLENTYIGPLIVEKNEKNF